MNTELKKYLESQGYTQLRETVEHGVVGILPFIFTAAIVCRMDMSEYGYRYCYENLSRASLALFAWDGKGHPYGWIKRKGLGEDLLNMKELKT